MTTDQPELVTPDVEIPDVAAVEEPTPAEPEVLTSCLRYALSTAPSTSRSTA